MSDDTLPNTPGTAGMVVMLLGGVVLPVLALAVELFTGMSRSVFFDPVPTVFHSMLIGAVPIANLTILAALRRARPLTARWMLFVSFATGIAAFYTLLYIPLTPLAPFAAFYFGFGFVLLAPMVSLIVLLRGKVLVQRLALAQALPPPRFAWSGIALALAALLAADLPSTMTRIGLRMSTSPSPVTSLNGIRLLRALGSESVMLRLCYHRSGMSTDLPGLLLDLDTALTPEHARTMFYRVTGTPFNSFPKPARHTLRNWDAVFDDDAGGDAVAGRAKGVALATSRMDGSIDAGAATAYLEWTMVFSNAAPQNQEARAEVVLPAGAVVSRLTLWIDGEEREAAFGGRAQVRQAYTNVVLRNRDPVLVTTSGKDRVLVQLFPIPPNGGKMKVRIGITAPLALADLQSAQLQLPSFSERNFDLAPSFRHAVWLEAGSQLQGGAALHAQRLASGAFALRGDIGEPAPTEAAALIVATRSPARTAAWSRDTKSDADGAVVQRLRMQPSVAPDRVALVIDGSLSMRDIKPQLIKAIAAFPANVELALILAGDETPEVFAHDRANVETTRDYLNGFAFKGGRDNGEALSTAWNWAAQRRHGAIVWVHGPQPVALASLEPLTQRFERNPKLVTLHDMAAVSGPDLIGKRLAELTPLTKVPRTGAVHEDLARLFAQWKPGAATPVLVRERQPAAGLPLPDKTSEHLARLWAAGQVSALLDGGELSQREEALALAVRYQLVTPVSGAVVLETREQFKQAGLEPVPPGSVPTIPEPETWLMMIVAVLVLLWRHRWRRLQPHGAAAA